MITKMLQALLALVLSALLSACGGGSGDPGGANPPELAPPVASAGANQTVVVGALIFLDGSSSSDPSGRPLTYAWQLSSAPAGSTAVLAPATLGKPSFTPDLVGAYVFSLTVSNGSSSSAAAQVTLTAQPIASLQIALDQSEPVSGTLNFSLSSATGASTVTWYVDLVQIGAGSSVAWSTLSATNATHLVVARLQLSPATHYEVRREVTVSNSSIALTVNVSGPSGAIPVDVSASSPYGIVGVSASLDGASLGTLSALNYCAGMCGGGYNVFRFMFDGYAVGSGNHTLVVTALDGTGNQRQLTIPVLVSNAPTLTLTSPVDGAMVHGSLQFSGSLAVDKPGVVTVVAKLGDVQIAHTTAQNFSGSYDLNGLAPGSYTFTISATDSTNAVTTLQRTVIVASSSALVYAPLFSLGHDGKLLAGDGDLVLYSTQSVRGEVQSVQLRNVVAGTEVVLQGGSAIAFATGWQVSDGRVYAYGKGGDCTVNFVCVYQWQADGSRVNLTAANPWAGSSYQQHPVAHDGYVVWCNDGDGTGSYTLYKVATGTYMHITAPNSVIRVVNFEYDFLVIDGVVNLFYSALTAGGADVYRWAGDTHTSTRLSTPGMRSLYPKTDGIRVAWSQSPVGSAVGGTTSLVSVLEAGGVPTLVSDKMNTFKLRDGVLAWLELTATSSVVKASSASGTTTLSRADSALFGLGGGQVVYVELRKVYSWNPAPVQARLRIDVWPSQWIIVGSFMYFSLGDPLRTGSTQTVYRMALN